MKKLLTAMAFLAFGAGALHAQSDLEACKAYIKEAKKVQMTAQNDPVSKAMFALYKDKVVTHCGNIVSKVPFDKNFFAKSLIKQEHHSIQECKMAIKMAQAYMKKDEVSPFIVQAHKVNIVDNCGTLVAKKAPAYCLFDTAQNVQKTPKEKCIAAINKAHAKMKTGAIESLKREVVANCGKLRASL